MYGKDNNGGEMSSYFKDVIIANKYGEVLFASGEQPVRIRLGEVRDLPERFCTWKYTEPECAWEAGCGRMFTFIDGGPGENRYHYCPGCGHLVKSPDSAPLGT